MSEEQLPMQVPTSRPAKMTLAEKKQAAANEEAGQADGISEAVLAADVGKSSHSKRVTEDLHMPVPPIWRSMQLLSNTCAICHSACIQLSG